MVEVTGLEPTAPTSRKCRKAFKNLLLLAEPLEKIPTIQTPFSCYNKKAVGGYFLLSASVPSPMKNETRKSQKVNGECLKKVCKITK